MTFYRFFNALKQLKDKRGLIIPLLFLLFILLPFSVSALVCLPDSVPKGKELIPAYIDTTTAHLYTDENYYLKLQFKPITDFSYTWEFYNGFLSYGYIYLEGNYYHWDCTHTYNYAICNPLGNLESQYLWNWLLLRPDLEIGETLNSNYSETIHFKTGKEYDLYAIHNVAPDIPITEDNYINHEYVLNNNFHYCHLGDDSLFYLDTDPTSLRISYDQNYIYDPFPLVVPDVYFDTPANYSDISTSPLLIAGHFENWNIENFKKLVLVGCSSETMRCIDPQEKTINQTNGNFSFSISKDLTIGLSDFYFNILSEDNWLYNPANSPELHLNILIDFDTTSPPYIPVAPETPEELKDPYIFYFENTEYETTTALFNSLTNSFGAGFVWIYNLLDIFDYFQLNNNVGQNIGEAMSTGRAYLGNLNAFFNDLPIIQMFFLYLGVMLIVGILRFIKYIRNLLPFV